MLNPIFKEFSEKWNLDYDAVHTIYLLISFSHQYKKNAKTLNKIGISLTPRQLKYFCRKYELTERYKSKEFIGLKNYRKVVLRKC